MDGITILIIVLVIIFIALLIFLVYAINKIIKEKSWVNNDEKVLTEDDLLKEIEYTEIPAVIVNMECGVKALGNKYAKSVERYLITFESDDGQKLEYDVDKESYLESDKGMCVILHYADGDFIGYTMA